MKRLTLLLLSLIISLPLAAQRDEIREDLDMKVSPSELVGVSEFIVKNINGNVSVTGYDGDVIRVTGTKSIWNKRGEISAEEASEFYLQKEIIGERVYLYMQAPGVKVRFRDDHMDYSMNWNRGFNEAYEHIGFTFDIKVEVPRALFISASTVNGGEVLVSEARNGAYVSNVNGDVTIKEVAGRTRANTVNGDIEVWFSESPKEDLRFNTVNGRIEIYSPKDLSAVVTFESLHGDLYTDFEQITRLPNRLNKEKDGRGYRYRINKTSPIQIGQGDIEMEFKMVNGSAYIRERKS